MCVLEELSFSVLLVTLYMNNSSKNDANCPWYLQCITTAIPSFDSKRYSWKMNNTVRNLDSNRWDGNSHPIVQTTHSAFLNTLLF